MTSTDQRTLAQIAEAVGWTAMDYKSLVADAERLMQTASFRQAYAAISAGLSQRSRLDECTLQTFACAVGRAHTKPTMERSRTFLTAWKTAPEPEWSTRGDELEFKAQVLEGVARREAELTRREAQALLSEFEYLLD